MIYVTSDLHGYPRAAFQRLLDQAAFSPQDELIVLGDVIDRNGDGGVSLLLWMMQQPNIRLILAFELIIPAQLHIVIKMDDLESFCDGFLLTSKALPEGIHI